MTSLVRYFHCTIFLAVDLDLLLTEDPCPVGASLSPNLWEVRMSCTRHSCAPHQICHNTEWLQTKYKPHIQLKTATFSFWGSWPPNFNVWAWIDFVLNKHSFEPFQLSVLFRNHSVWNVMLLTPSSSVSTSLHSFLHSTWRLLFQCMKSGQVLDDVVFFWQWSGLNFHL